MKKLFSVFSLVFSGLLVLSATEKNLYNVSWRGIPAQYETLLSEPESWNMNFFPVGGGDDTLWSDPAVNRSILSGQDTDGKSPTGIFVSCDAEGFNVLVFSAVPGMKKALEDGKSLPASCLECFFVPGDSDDDVLHHYWQFIFQQNVCFNGRLEAHQWNQFLAMFDDFPWLATDRNFKPITRYLQIENRILGNGYISRITVPWRYLWNNLPFGDKKDNFWRLSVIRWAAVSQTWGGYVHRVTPCGYIRWPEFTQAQKDMIRKNVLISAWQDYQLVAFNWRTPQGGAEPWRREKDAAFPRTFMNLEEYLTFMETHMKPLLAECDAIGQRIAAFDSLSPEEKDAVYAQIRKLTQFRYDVQEAYRQYRLDILFGSK